MLRHRSVIHVEVTQRTKCNVDRGQLKTLIKNFVSSGIESLPVTLSGCDELKELNSYVERIQISTEGASMSSDSLLKVHIYKLNAEGNYYEYQGVSCDLFLGRTHAPRTSRLRCARTRVRTPNLKWSHFAPAPALSAIFQSFFINFSNFFQQFFSNFSTFLWFRVFENRIRCSETEYDDPKQEKMFLEHLFLLWNVLSCFGSSYSVFEHHKP